MITTSDSKLSSRWYWRVATMPQALIMFVGFSFFSYYESGYIIFPAILFLILLILFVIICYYIYISFFSIDFGQDNISVHQGVIQKKHIYIPYQKIQNVFIERDLWDRILGTSRVIIENFGSGNVEIVFGFKIKAPSSYQGSKGYYLIPPCIRGERLFLPGLLPENAIKIKDFILSKQKELAKSDIITTTTNNE